MNRKGVFVPLEIWHISELNPNERVLLAEVASFNEQKKKCYATNKHFADLLQVSEQTARKYIYHLIELGYLKRGVVQNEQGGTNRTLGWCKRNRGVVQSYQKGGINVPHTNTLLRQSTKSFTTTKGKSPKITEIVLPFQTEKFSEAWNEWKEYKRTDHRFKYKSAQSEQRALIKLQNEHTEETEAINAIHRAIANGWKGLVFGESKNGRANAGRAADLQSDSNREKFAEFARTGRITTDRGNVL